MTIYNHTKEQFYILPLQATFKKIDYLLTNTVYILIKAYIPTIFKRTNIISLRIYIYLIYIIN